MFQKHKYEIIFGLFLLTFILLFNQLYQIILPVLLALLFAATFNPTIERIQKVLKTRTLAVTAFFIGICGIFTLILIFSVNFVNRDFQRLNQTFKVMSAKSDKKIDQSAQKAKDFINKFYDFNSLENQITNKVDSIKATIQSKNSSQLDTEAFQEAYGKLKSLYQQDQQNSIPEKSGYGFLFIFFSTLFYFVLILYHYEYFVSLRKKYENTSVNSKLNQFYEDFNRTFILYFKLRSKVIFISSFVYGIAFLIMDLPGMFIITFFILILSYIPYLQLVALIPLSISCLVQAIENDQNFLILFGIVICVFILVIILDQFILTPRIIESKIDINPVVLVVFLSIWASLFGFYGIIFGIPLTSFFIIYLKRYLIPSLNKVSVD